jgi:hypothetical protein
MVAFEPDLKQVVELPVFRDVFRRNVAVVIENRFRLGVFMIEFAGGLRAQQKIFVDKSHIRAPKLPLKPERLRGAANF